MNNVDSDASLRGLHVLDKTTVWASGSKGTIINTTDGGDNWTVRTVDGAEDLDFRDIHAIDDGTVVAMTSGTPARIYRSTNGGISWKLCYENKDERVFLDALSFWDDQNGIVMGDPIGEAVFLLRTTDGGRTWSQFKTAPQANKGEAGFAASGTNAIALGTQKYLIALGGAEKGDSHKSSRVVMTLDRGGRWFAATVPMHRTESAGIFSLCFVDEKYGVAVGGDYQQPDATDGNYAITSDGGRTWTSPKTKQSPSGYRSGVAVSRKGREIRLVAVGPNGTDVSLDLGKKWRKISNEGFHAVDFTSDGTIGWATGADGRIGRWTNRFDAKQK
ncbi:MAG: YCF48-related protein [Planctomycetota bacterium]